MYQSLTVALDDGVAAVTLNRPEVHNAFQAALIAEFTAAFVELGADERVRTLVLTGAGTSFSAGADIAAMRAGLDLTTEETRADAERLADLFATIDACPRPTIARINIRQLCGISKGEACGITAGLIADLRTAPAGQEGLRAFLEKRPPAWVPAAGR